MNRLDLWLDPHIALAVALVPDHADRGFMDEVHLGAQFAGDPECLAVAARMIVDQNWLGFRHRLCLPESLPGLLTGSPGARTSVWRFFHPLEAKRH